MVQRLATCAGNGMLACPSSCVMQRWACLLLLFKPPHCHRCSVQVWLGRFQETDVAIKQLHSLGQLVGPSASMGEW